MTTHQQNKTFTVKEIVAIVKKLSQKDKEKLLDIIWVYYAPPFTAEEIRDIEERLKKSEEDPSRCIPFEKLEKRWASRK